MYKIVKKEVLNSVVVMMEIEAPYVAARCEAGQFVIVPHLNRPVGAGSLYFSNHNTLQVCCLVSCFYFKIV